VTMSRHDARAVLGVPDGASRTEVRRAFRRLIQLHHPDHAGAGAGERAARLTEAYRVLLAAPPEPAPPPPAPRVEPEIWGPSVRLPAAPAAAFAAVVEAADRVGEVSYVDRATGMVQVVVRPPDGPTCWLTLDVRPHERGTAVHASLESIEAAPAPDPGPYLRLLAHELVPTHPPRGSAP